MHNQPVRVRTCMLFLSFLVGLLVFIQGCKFEPVSSKPMSDESGDITIHIALAKSTAFSQVAHSAVVSISHDVFDDISEELTITESAVEGTIQGIPCGSNYSVKVFVYDENENLVYYGETQVDIKPDIIVTADITLYHTTGGLSVNGTIIDAPEPVQVSDRLALTWVKRSYNEELEIVNVGKDSFSNPYSGDTPISEELPILALKVDYSPRPNYAVAPSTGVMHKEYYRGWSCGTVMLTPPIAGYLLTSKAVADSICEFHCGEGYRMAEYHDGKYVMGMDLDVYYGETWPAYETLSSGAHYFFSYGEIADDTRFWVSINDQNANPWD